MNGYSFFEQKPNQYGLSSSRGLTSLVESVESICQKLYYRNGKGERKFAYLIMDLILRYFPDRTIDELGRIMSTYGEDKDLAMSKYFEFLKYMAKSYIHPDLCEEAYYKLKLDAYAEQSGSRKAVVNKIYRPYEMLLSGVPGKTQQDIERNNKVLESIVNQRGNFHCYFCGHLGHTLSKDCKDFVRYFNDKLISCEEGGHLDQKVLEVDCTIIQGLLHGHRIDFDPTFYNYESEPSVGFLNSNQFTDFLVKAMDMRYIRGVM
jgi:hypothetical protein